MRFNTVNDLKTICLDEARLVSIKLGGGQLVICAEGAVIRSYNPNIAIGRCGAVEPAVGERAEPALGERPGAVLAGPVAAGKARGGIAAHAERALWIQPVGE